MRTHIFLLFFIVGATLVGVHARPAEDDNTEVTDDPATENGKPDDGTKDNKKCHEESPQTESPGVHVVLRSIRPERKFDSALLLQAPIPDDIPLLSDMSSGESREDQETTTDSYHPEHEDDYCPVAIIMSLLDHLFCPLKTTMEMEEYITYMLGFPLLKI